MAETLSAREVSEVERFVHRVGHLSARKGLAGYAEQVMVGDCWGFPLADVPQWTVDLAEQGGPGSKWCPIIDPALAESV